MAQNGFEPTDPRKRLDAPNVRCHGVPRLRRRTDDVVRRRSERRRRPRRQVEDPAVELAGQTDRQSDARRSCSGRSGKKVYLVGPIYNKITHAD